MLCQVLAHERALLWPSRLLSPGWSMQWMSESFPAFFRCLSEGMPRPKSRFDDKSIQPSSFQPLTNYFNLIENDSQFYCLYYSRTLYFSCSFVSLKGVQLQDRKTTRM